MLCSPLAVESALDAAGLQPDSVQGADRHRSADLNRLHRLPRDLLPAGAPSDLSAAKAAALLRGLRPATATAACRRQLTRDLLGDLRRVDARLAHNKVQLQTRWRPPIAP